MIEALSRAKNKDEFQNVKFNKQKIQFIKK